MLVVAPCLWLLSERFWNGPHSELSCLFLVTNSLRLARSSISMYSFISGEMPKMMMNYCFPSRDMHGLSVLPSVSRLVAISLHSGWEPWVGLRHADGGGNGCVPLHDPARVCRGLRGVPAQALGSPRSDDAVRAHGHKLQAGIHSPRGVFITLGVDGSVHKRL